MYMVHRHKTFLKKIKNEISHFCYRLLTNLLVRSLWWSIHSVDHQYSSGFIGGPTPLPVGKPKTKGVLLVCYNTIQERMRIRQFNTHIGLFLMVIPLKLFLEIASSSPRMMLPCAFLGNFRWRWKCVKSPVACPIVMSKLRCTGLATFRHSWDFWNWEWAKNNLGEKLP